jgi:Arc/MetJ-type ribon-helix-helix transcriptional regulator
VGVKHYDAFCFSLNHKDQRGSTQGVIGRPAVVSRGVSPVMPYLGHRNARENVPALPHGRFSRILEAMDVQLTPDQQAFARRAIESGRLHSEKDAVQEALALWEERERQRTEFLLTLEDARASLSRGEGRVITQESVQQLAQEVKERGRARLLAELSTPR